jgi:hypothetical protein
MRKQVYDLTPADLKLFPIWEFASDEEGIEGQDEATVRPVDLNKLQDALAGLCVAKARFSLADGSAMGGYLTSGMPGDSYLGSIQPAIVVDDGQVSFWCGTVEPTQEYIESSYALLGKKPEEIFPLLYTLDTELVGYEISGTVPGFLVLERWNSSSTRVIR